MDPLFDLRHKVAVVTGGSRGIGRAVAIALAERGAKITLAARSREDLERARGELESLGAECTVMAADLRRGEDILKLFAEVRDRHGRLDVLVNNAGVSLNKTAFEVTEDDWDRVLDTNLKAVFFCCREAAPLMVSGGGGRIVNISSQLAFIGLAGRSVYGASKAGVAQLTKMLAVEWGPLGIRVNAVAPTWVRTEMTSKILGEGSLMKEISDKMPLRRIAEPEDVAAAVLFLASDASAMVTGHTLLVDGGWTAL